MPLPLSALLSQALVAFTIELDNAFEQRMDVHTTDFGGRRPGSVWTTSLRQWSNFMRLVDADGVTVAELERRAGRELPLHGMRRWRYVTISQDGPARQRIVTPTVAGARAQAVWRPLPKEIEQRWRTRFASADRSRAALEELLAGLGLALPQWLTSTYGGFADGPIDTGDPPASPELLPFSALLSQALQAFALQYEDGEKVSLCFTANLLRVLGGDGVRPRDLPALTGVATPALTTALGILEKRGFVALAPDPQASRGKVVTLTERGERARAAYPRRTRAVERDWEERVGAGLVGSLRTSLEAIVARDGEPSPLFAGLIPPPGTWRSQVPQLPLLPDYPMPRQGGHPDGV